MHMVAVRAETLVRCSRSFSGRPSRASLTMQVALRAAGRTAGCCALMLQIGLVRCGRCTPGLLLIDVASEVSWPAFAADSRLEVANSAAVNHIQLYTTHPALSIGLRIFCSLFQLAVSPCLRSNLQSTIVQISLPMLKRLDLQLVG